MLPGDAQPRRMRALVAQQDVVVAAHAIDECDGHAAARVAELRLFVMLRQREQRKRLLDVLPLVRIELLPLRQHACILEMAEADVERGQCEPRAIGLLDALGKSRLEVAEVTRGTEHARARVGPVADAKMPRGFLGELHEAANAGLAARERLPSRFLVGDRCERAPLDAGRLLRFEEQAAVVGQHRSHAVLEYPSVNPAYLARVREVTLREASDEAVLRRLRKERIQLVPQRVVAGTDEPGKLELRIDAEPDVEVQIDIAGERRLQRADQRVVDDSVADAGDQRVGRWKVEWNEAHTRMLECQAGDLGVEAGRRDVADDGAVEIAPRLRTEPVAAEDHHQPDRMEPRRPFEWQRHAFGGSRWLRIGWAIQAAEAEMGFTACQLRGQGRSAVDG